MLHKLAVLAIAFVSWCAARSALAQAPDAAPSAPPTPALTTRWAKNVSQTLPWPEYPRPTLVRERWQNLNGKWTYAILGEDPDNRDAWQGEILVPYPVESALSGVAKRVGPKQTLHYGRTFRVPAEWRTNGQRVMLHFGAVDWHASVRVNAKPIGEHKGGYDPFSFDITDALKPGDEPNEITVMAMDPTNEGGQPRGKQWNKPHGIWYTPTTGIWQTVWMEPVPRTRIERLGRAAITTLQGGQPACILNMQPTITGDTTGVIVEALVLHEGQEIARARGEASGGARTVVPAQVWRPDRPTLYDLIVRLTKDGQVLDEVRSYAAWRHLSVAKDSDGHNRLMLNGQPTFMFGPLDQGFWPDGLYTAPTLEALRFDIEAAKKMGCNMLRKHVKVEPEIFYYECDRLGLMVWQDMPSPFFEVPPGVENGVGVSKGWDEDFPAITDEWKANFEREWKEITTDFAHHPSIVMWVPFNEGWGQNDLEWAKAMTLKTKEWDPTRLVNCASGWTDTKVGDVFDIHVYPGPARPSPMGDFDASRAMVLGEFGGLGLPIEGHTWQAKNNWGYVSYKSPQELTNAYVALLDQIPWLIADGLAAAVYTQTTDVEIEVNGWLTYDRAMWKIDPARASPAAKKLYEPTPKVQVLVPCASHGKPGTWRHTARAPAANWMTPTFDDSSWRQGQAGFGTARTPGAIIGTEWNSTELWLRRHINLPEAGEAWHTPALIIHHDEDAEVYLNGELAVSLKGYTTAYRIVPLPKEAAALLRSGVNHLAVHVKQTNGGQYIDVGLVDLVAAPAGSPMAK